MKKVIYLLGLGAALNMSAQSFVAGWDFDGVGAADTSHTANWGEQAGSALLTWTHDVAAPPFTPAEFVVGGTNDTTASDSFTGVFVGDVDPQFGFANFSDGPVAASQAAFVSSSNSDTLSFAFDGSGFTGLSLRYGLDTGSGYSVQTVDLSAFDGNAAASYQFTTANGASYDNFAITGTVVPEPSAYAAIIGAVALAFVASRRRK